jgi:hypothetical protein
MRGYGMAVCMRWAGVGVLESNIPSAARELRLQCWPCRHAACVIPVKLLAPVLPLVLAPRPRRPLRSPAFVPPIGKLYQTAHSRLAKASFWPREHRP